VGYADRLAALAPVDAEVVRDDVADFFATHPHHAIALESQDATQAESPAGGEVPAGSSSSA